MASDIKLEDHEVIVEGYTLRVSGADLVLDGGPARRPADQDLAHPRRALVTTSTTG